jgi:hypothetical protein
VFRPIGLSRRRHIAALLGGVVRRAGLDAARFTEDLGGHVGANRIAQDLAART